LSEYGRNAQLAADMDVGEFASHTAEQNHLDAFRWPVENLYRIRVE
jgi:hypothetical protein